MNDFPFQDTIFLKQGEIFFSNKPSIVKTILGSCVSVTFHSPRLQYSGMIHAMFPYFKPESKENPLLYVDFAVKNLIDHFSKAGIGSNEIEVKLFGGGAVIITDYDKKTVGDKNISAAISILNINRLNILVKNVGSNYGRKIYFHTDSGKVFLKRIYTNGSISMKNKDVL